MTLPTARELFDWYKFNGNGAPYPINAQEYVQGYGRFAINAAAVAFQEKYGDLATLLVGDTKETSDLRGLTSMREWCSVFLGVIEVIFG